MTKFTPDALLSPNAFMKDFDKFFVGFDDQIEIGRAHV